MTTSYKKKVLNYEDDFVEFLNRFDGQWAIQEVFEDIIKYYNTDTYGNEIHLGWNPRRKSMSVESQDLKIFEMNFKIEKKKSPRTQAEALYKKYKEALPAMIAERKAVVAGKLPVMHDKYYPRVLPEEMDNDQLVDFLSDSENWFSDPDGLTQTIVRQRGLTKKIIKSYFNRRNIQGLMGETLDIVRSDKNYAIRTIFSDTLGIDEVGIVMDGQDISTLDPKVIADAAKQIQDHYDDFSPTIYQHKVLDNFLELAQFIEEL